MAASLQLEKSPTALIYLFIYFSIWRWIASSCGDQLVAQRLTVQHPQTSMWPVLDAKCLHRLVGGSHLSPNDHSPTRAACNQSQTGEGLQITAVRFINVFSHSETQVACSCMSYHHFIAILIHQSLFVNTSWVLADLIPVFEAALSKAMSLQVHCTRMQWFWSCCSVFLVRL